MNSPFFSVIIPAYNTETFIQTTLHSVLSQDRQDWEALVVNDGSTDNTPQLVRQIKDPRIRLINQPNAGVSQARNTGMRHAQGQYLAFLDADDLWYPEHLSLAAQFFHRHPDIPYYSGRHIEHSATHGLPARPAPHKPRIRHLGTRGLMFLHPSNMVIRKTVAAALPPWQTGMSYGEDCLYQLRLMRRHAFVGTGGTVTAVYRQHPGSVMHDTARYMAIPLQELVGLRLAELEQSHAPQRLFAAQFTIVRDFWPERLLATPSPQRRELLHRMAPLLHPLLNRPLFTAYMRLLEHTDPADTASLARARHALHAVFARTVKLMRLADRLQRLLPRPHRSFSRPAD